METPKEFLNNLNLYDGNNDHFKNAHAIYKTSQLMEMYAEHYHQEKLKLLDIGSVSKRYSEKDMLNAAKYGYEYRDTTSFPEMGFDSNCKNNTRQWLTTVK